MRKAAAGGEVVPMHTVAAEPRAKRVAAAVAAAITNVLGKSLVPATASAASGSDEEVEDALAAERTATLLKAGATRGLVLRDDPPESEEDVRAPGLDPAREARLQKAARTERADRLRQGVAGDSRPHSPASRKTARASKPGPERGAPATPSSSS